MVRLAAVEQKSLSANHPACCKFADRERQFQARATNIGMKDTPALTVAAVVFRRLTPRTQLQQSVNPDA